MGQANGSVSYDDLTQEIPAKELSTLLKVSSALASTLDLAEVLRITIESATTLFSIDTGAIYTLEKGDLYLGATVPAMPPEFPEELRLAHLKDHPHIRKSVTSKKPVYLPDARKAILTPAEQVAVVERQLISLLYYPLLFKNDVIGVFIVGTNKGVRDFTENELDLCAALSGQSALAISNAKLYEQAQQAIVDITKAYDATLEGWSRVLDMRDHVTDRHTHRVADLTVDLAKNMGVPESDLGDIKRGALLHDIGKMGIPDAILQKPDVLTEDEWATMQTHPELAYKFLSHISYLMPALDIPLCHHEKWDGTGYPRKLKGEEIPLAARIFTVVDVYDALTSDRPYRKAWKKADALVYLREQSGKHFFPEAVDAFLEMLGK
jgi:HD-GYP domain-containing protein (c-di-GMP phosphodiesterase class II)